MFWFYLFWEHICQAGPRYCPGPTRGQMMGRLAGGLGGRPGGQGTFAKLKSKEKIWIFILFVEFEYHKKNVPTFYVKFLNLI